jgi:hypothetical protein
VFIQTCGISYCRSAAMVRSSLLDGMMTPSICCSVSMLASGMSSADSTTFSIRL